MIPTDTGKTQEREQLKNHTQNATNYLCLAGPGFFATVRQVEKVGSDRQSTGKLEREKSARPLGV